MSTLQKILLPIFILIAFESSAQQISFTSKGKNSTVVELFTSQGCNSCPPAEEYINSYVDNKTLWSKYIPIVFHVDYWDYIGWKDIFAKPEFTARQYRYAKLKHVRTVYTPAFIVNGKAWRRGFFNSTPDIKGLDNGILDLVINAKNISASFKAQTTDSLKHRSKDLLLNVAILGMDIVVDITAGENQGREAKNNFVVVGYAQLLADNFSWHMQLPEIKPIKSSRYAVVAWVSIPSDPTPLQAVGGWLP